MSEKYEGTVEPRFARVLEAFLRHFDDGLDIGAAVCIYHRGRSVVDIWSGDAGPSRPWTENTLVPLTSITKSVLATLILVLAQQGVIDLDAPVREYWPEFAAEGKSEISVQCALSHQAGIAAFNHPISLAEQQDRGRMAETVSSLRPLWKPGCAHGYHAITLGFLLSEVLYRVTGCRTQTLVQKMLQESLNADVHLGLCADDVPRVATMIPPPDDVHPGAEVPRELEAYLAAMIDHTSLTYRATFGSTAMTFADMNDSSYYTAGRPAAYATASAVARVFAALVSEIYGQRLLVSGWTERARTSQCDGTDQVFQMRTSWGLGYLLPGGPLWPDFGVRAFGHIGSSGAIAFADPDNSLSLAFLPNRMKSVIECTDRRATRLIEATYASL